MNEKPYEVIVTTSYGLNITLTPRKGTRHRYFSHLMSYDESVIFADRLRHAEPSQPQNLTRGNCLHCGKPCYTTQELFELTGQDRIIHAECFAGAMMRDIHIAKQAAAYIDPRPAIREMRFEYPAGPPNGYQIGLADNGMVLISIFDCGKRKMCNAYLAPEESAALAKEMENKLRLIKRCEIGSCLHCGKLVHADHTRYHLNNGSVAHGVCMDRLLASGIPPDSLFPARKALPDDLFGFVRQHGERRIV